MFENAALRHAISEIEAMDRRLGNMVTDDEMAWRHELIRIRRAMAAALQTAAGAIEDCERAGLPTGKVAELRERFSALRSRLAFHQASFPACIATYAPDYRTSLARIADAQCSFLACARGVFTG